MTAFASTAHFFGESTFSLLSKQKFKVPLGTPSCHGTAKTKPPLLPRVRMHGATRIGFDPHDRHHRLVAGKDPRRDSIVQVYCDPLFHCIDVEKISMLGYVALSPLDDFNKGFGTT